MRHARLNLGITEEETLEERCRSAATAVIRAANERVETRNKKYKQVTARSRRENFIAQKHSFKKTNRELKSQVFFLFIGTKGCKNEFGWILKK